VDLSKHPLQRLHQARQSGTVLVVLVVLVVLMLVLAMHMHLIMLMVTAGVQQLHRCWP
jgi:uncharacterized membrane protein YhaH (DUF805 family)